MNAFLDPDELRTLTGYKRAADQIRRLQALRIPHLVNALGKPVVLRGLDALKSEPEVGEVR